MTIELDKFVPAHVPGTPIHPRAEPLDMLLANDTGCKSKCASCMAYGCQECVLCKHCVDHSFSGTPHATITIGWQNRKVLVDNRVHMIIGNDAVWLGDGVVAVHDEARVPFSMHTPVLASRYSLITIRQYDPL